MFLAFHGFTRSGKWAVIYDKIRLIIERYNQILVTGTIKAYPIESHKILIYPLLEAGKEGYAHEEW